jgi:hypothetical protein
MDQNTNDSKKPSQNETPKAPNIPEKQNDTPEVTISDDKVQSETKAP